MDDNRPRAALTAVRAFWAAVFGEDVESIIATPDELVIPCASDTRIPLRGLQAQVIGVDTPPDYLDATLC